MAQINTNINYTQNDYYYIRFGHHLGIEHVLALYLYCGYTDLCEKFSKTYIGRFDEKEEDIQRKHYLRFYWLGRFLYEAVEFFGKTNITQPLYVGIDQRVLLKSIFGEFHKPISGLFFLFFDLYLVILILDMIIYSN